MGLTLTEIFAIIIIHWIADFVLQTDKQAKGKSKNWNDLLSHTLTYTFVWFIVGFIYIHLNDINNVFTQFQVKILFLFTFITFIAHTITDYFTSRLNSRLWAEGKVHNFFVSVSADQVYHYIQLFLTYYYLKTL
jgi:hypothetical protein